MGDLFRKDALDTISSPEQLDKSIRIISPRGWLALIGMGILLAVVIIWSFIGSIPQKVTGQGILIASGDVYSINSPVGGMIKDVFVTTGDTIKNGQVLARIQRNDLLDQLQILQQNLGDLEHEYDTVSKNESSNLKLSRMSTEENIKSLRLRNSQLNSQKNTQITAVKKLQKLYKDGLVTGQQLKNAQDELSSINSQLSQIQVQIAEVTADTYRTKSTSQAQLLVIEQKIAESRKQIEIEQMNYREQTKIVSTINGTVLGLNISRGTSLAAGDSVAVIEVDTSGVKSYQAILYFNINDGKKVKTGMNIGISPSIVKQEEYGHILGIVTDVSGYPVSSRHIMETVLNEGYTDTFSKIGVPLEIKADLIPDVKTFSGYRWSSSTGPDLKLTSGLLCTGSVTVSDQHPIQLIIPYIKKNILGVGDDTTINRAEK
jgi:HlyD family secretion protein